MDENTNCGKCGSNKIVPCARVIDIEGRDLSLALGAGEGEI